MYTVHTWILFNTVRIDDLRKEIEVVQRDFLFFFFNLSELLITHSVCLRLLKMWLCNVFHTFYIPISMTTDCCVVTICDWWTDVFFGSHFRYTKVKWQMKDNMIERCEKKGIIMQCPTTSSIKLCYPSKKLHRNSIQSLSLWIWPNISAHTPLIYLFLAVILLFWEWEQENSPLGISWFACIGVSFAHSSTIHSLKRKNKIRNKPSDIYVPIYLFAQP